jgi:hypothetical protein
MTGSVLLEKEQNQHKLVNLFDRISILVKHKGRANKLFRFFLHVSVATGAGFEP